MTVKKERERYIDLMTGGVFIGLFISFTGITAPVHELGHILAALLYGVEIEAISWGVTTLSGYNIIILVAGPLFEIAVMMGIAWTLGRKWTLVGWIGYGAAFEPMVLWWISKDRAMLPGGINLIIDVVYVTICVYVLWRHRVMIWSKQRHIMSLIKGVSWKTQTKEIGKSHRASGIGIRSQSGYKMRSKPLVR